IADRIAVMNAGEVVQLGPPLDLYQAPRNRWVARFIGAHPINLYDARLAGEGDRAFLLPGDRWPVTVPADVMAAIRSRITHPEITVGIRPEHQIVDSGAAAPVNELSGEVYTRQILGTDILYEIKAGDHILRAVTPTARLFDVGSPVRVGLDWSNVFVFDRQTETCLYPTNAA
ncbi:MAG: multiple sugar transport system ATP-binding protein, partial [Thermomicrobiales bacterium]|nr:multiple sugar transport system ATP-binding protein [Thermomicrobiales bacterium]